MNILAVDTTGAPLGLALRAGERVYVPRRRAAIPAKPHDETLIPAAARLLAKAGLRWSDLDAIAAASGPGRFTGIRIGMAYAAVAAAQLKIAAVAVSRFAAAALESGAPKSCVILSGPRGEKFYQPFELRSGLPEPLDAPAWTQDEAAWPGLLRSWRRQGFAVLEADPGARAILKAAGRLLDSGKIPPFEPLYLKTAGYEKRTHPARP